MFELPWVCPVFVLVNAVPQSFTPGNEASQAKCWIGQE